MASVWEQATELRNKARQSKRLAGYHRKEAQRYMQALAIFCDTHGIDLTLVTAESIDNGTEEHNCR